ncbi:hypothetical protein [Brachybacterium massiliense]|uniref:hypothetical protein n=1 Tax=Brachybacterium massiliense TaxID=1755098 RepID=UPI000B3BC4F2|nr:hypothetical protein [Brachybacterium massiliense]
MDLKTWLVDSLTGDVITRVHMTDRSRFTSVIGGGRMTGEVVLSSLRDRDGSRDTSALLTVLQAMGGGRHSILLTSGTETLGEWVVFGYVRDHDAATAAVSGFEWDDYLQYRSIHTDFKYTNADAGQIYHDAMVDVFNTFQPADREIVVSTAPTLGHRMDMKTLPRTGYYSDLIGDLDALGLTEWRIVPTATWADGAPVKVTRTVTYQQPILSTPHPDPLVKAGPGERGGNLTEFSRSYDFSRIAGTVIGWGAGKGKKQRYAMSQDGNHLSRGHIAITRNVHHSGEYSNAQLQMKTDQVLADSKDPWQPTQATVDGRRLSRPPVIGGVHDVSVAPAWTYPEGGSWRMRVGQATYAYGSPLVDVEMEEVE